MSETSATRDQLDVLRVVTIIKNGTAIWEQTYDYPFWTDSQALHYALAQVDPGDNYTVTFHNK